MDLSSESIRILDESVRSALQDLRDSYFLWLMISTGVVFVGVLLEEVPSLPFPKPRWINRIARVGWLMIMAGVMGEGVFEALVSRADGVLQVFNNISIVSAEREAASAWGDAESANVTAKGFEIQIEDSKARVITAEGRVQAAEAQIASANTASKEAVAKVATAEARIASAIKAASEADARAAEAQKVAEGERLERIKLEALVSPRRLSVDQQRLIADALRRRFAGRTVAVSSYGLDGEGAILGAQIIETLKSAGINPVDELASSMGAGDFDLGIHIRGPDSAKDFVAGLADALYLIGKLQVWRNTPVPRLGASFVSRPTMPPGTVVIMVGIKPVPVVK